MFLNRFLLTGPRAQHTVRLRLVKSHGLLQLRGTLLMTYAGVGNHTWCLWLMKSIIARCTAFQAVFPWRSLDPYIQTGRFYDFV
jgi:hypothetical protein